MYKFASKLYFLFPPETGDLIPYATQHLGNVSLLFFVLSFGHSHVCHFVGPQAFRVTLIIHHNTASIVGMTEDGNQ